MNYTALAAGTLAYWRYLEARGVEPRAVFERAGVDPAALTDHDARYSEAGYARLTRAFRRWTGTSPSGHRAAN